MSEAGKTEPVVPHPPTPPAAPAQAAQATIEDFQRLAFRVGIITAAADHPNADRLLVLTVDIGEGQPRQVVAGIRGSYEAASLVGKHVVVVANLKPAMLRGVESQGMVLAASDGTSLVLVSPEKPVPAGRPVK
ncbi:MAG: methionine--tRNA ligase subunit beta [Candidatus Omnitrophica bacterium CG11_big_fil_rev_8_21_14_0_20_63_9]|nr:MAG: methionine--tRNA ligase subunit beta [Candidatus Omnitrophica bacterium CG11_big_fil_rev_8_21_14_0_20_63_9]